MFIKHNVNILATSLASPNSAIIIAQRNTMIRQLSILMSITSSIDAFLIPLSVVHATNLIVPSRQQSEPPLPLCYRPPQFYEELPGGDDSSTRAPLVPSREDMSRLNMPYFLNRREEMIQLDIATCDDVTMCYSEGEYLVRTVQVMMAVILSAYIVLFAQIQMLVPI